MIRLNVAYKEKDEAKRYGARWNPSGKFWYYDGDILPEELKRWDSLRDDPSGKAQLPAANVSGADPDKAGQDINFYETADRFYHKPADIPAGMEWLKKYQTVSQINEMIQSRYDSIPEFRNIMVRGEVTNFSAPNRGNYYFDIKDDTALLSCVMWERTAQAVLNFRFRPGIQVAITGYLNLYKGSGKTSLIVRHICDAGEGAAALELLKLHARLEAEGLFDEKYKKPVPKYPKTVGVVTSKGGKAIGDICQTAKGRNPYVQIVLYHVNVQGKYAVDTIIKGIGVLDRMDVDTIIVGRGGGSDEELKAYNDERVVRAVFQARTPVISAVGHEGNWSLTDYAADLRVSTPTKAAVVAFPDLMTDINRIKQLRQSISSQMISQLRQRQLLLKARQAALESLNPQRLLKEKQNNLDNLYVMLRQKMQDAFNSRKHRCDVLMTQLHGLSPTAKLVKGFGYISKDNAPVTGIEQVDCGDSLEILIHDGRIYAKVTDTQKVFI